VIIAKKLDCNEMVVAMDGEQVWQLLQEKDVDLVVSGWNTPKKRWCRGNRHTCLWPSRHPESLVI